MHETLHYVAEWLLSPSTIDWCERNYEITNLIAEFYNTISSLAMVICGVAGLIAHWRFGKRFALLFALYTLVGVGSVAFHATLKFPLQLLDELPMLWCATSVLFCILERGSRPPKHGIWLPLSLGGFALLSTVLAMMHGDYQVTFFQSSFIAIQLFDIYMINRFIRVDADCEARRMWNRALGSYAIATLCWLADLKFCEWLDAWPLGNPQLHAFWHIFAATGSYILCMLCVYLHIASSGYTPKVEYVMGIYPIAGIQQGVMTRRQVKARRGERRRIAKEE